MELVKRWSAISDSVLYDTVQVLHILSTIERAVRAIFLDYPCLIVRELMFFHSRTLSIEKFACQRLTIHNDSFHIDLFKNTCYLLKNLSCAEVTCSLNRKMARAIIRSLAQYIRKCYLYCRPQHETDKWNRLANSRILNSLLKIEAIVGPAIFKVFLC